MKDYLIIPAYNEEENIAKVINQAKPYLSNIIVVDDGSRDDTFARAQATSALVLRHRVNLGKGAALKTGCDYALQQGAERIVVMDADGQHDPREIPVFLEALKEKEIVFGTRKVQVSMPLVLRFGNSFISNTLKILYGIDVSDSQCGYRAFTASAYKKICWEAADYYVETEMIIKTGQHKLTHQQLPIETIYSNNYKGTTVVDGVFIVAKMMGGRIFK